MRSFNKISLVAVALMSSSILAQAADPVPMQEDNFPPEIVVPYSASGWYLRGDIGYASLKLDGIEFEQFDPIAVTFARSSFGETDLDSTWTLSGGIGYQVTDYFRVDATIKRFGNTEMNGSSSTTATFLCSGLSPDNGIADTCSASDSADFSATSIMANAYWDLGTYQNFTPYVGAGIGGAHVRWGRLENDIGCDTALGDCLNGFGDDYNITHDTEHRGEDGLRFAWAIHAGASYDLRCDLKLDAGYTYTRIQGGDMFNWPLGNVLTGTQGVDGGIEVHEGRVGLRYAWDGGGCGQQAIVRDSSVVYK